MDSPYKEPISETKKNKVSVSKNKGKVNLQKALKMDRIRFLYFAPKSNMENVYGFKKEEPKYSKPVKRKGSSKPITT